MDGLLNINAKTMRVEGEFQFDIIKWIDEGAEKKLSEYKFPFDKETLIFEYTKDQIKIRDDYFKRYGNDINALSKVVTRITNLESQFRKVRYKNDTYSRDIYKKVGENFVRYTLSNWLLNRPKIIILESASKKLGISLEKLESTLFTN